MHEMVGVTVEPEKKDCKRVVSGAYIFQMKDTYGFPFSASFQECEKKNVMIDWVGLIEAARKHGWFDYQTMEQICEAFTDSGAWPDKRIQIIERLKSYIITHPCSL